MTKPQIWIAAVLVLFFLLFFLEMNTKRSDVQPNVTPAAEQQSGQAKTPAQLISSIGCTGCHGAGLTGTNMAPDLHGVGKYWSKSGLVNFLRDPSSYMSGNRFKAYRAKYTVTMPSFNNINIKELGKIADYLLKLK